MSFLAFLSLGFPEMLVIAVVAILVFGGRLPEVMRNLGRGYAKFRHGMNDLTHPIRQELRDLDVRTPSSSIPHASGAPDTEPPPEPDLTTLQTPLDDGRADVEPTPVPPPPYRARSTGAADEPPPV